MLSCPELLVASVKESILDAGGIFNRHIVVDDEQDAGRQHPLLGRQLDQDVFAPDVRVSHGRPTIFIPTKAIIATVQVLHFFLENHISMILIGARGCGKSLSLSKVVPHLSTGWTVKYLLLGGIFKLHTFKILLYSQTLYVSHYKKLHKILGYFQTRQTTHTKWVYYANSPATRTTS